MRRFPLFGTLLIAVLFALSSVAPALAQSPAASPVAPPAASPFGSTHGVQLADMDLSVDPAQDFYQFANGGWLARTEIPADAASYGVFDELYDKTEAQQLAQLDDLMNGNTLVEGSDQWKAVEFFKQGTDMETRNAQGIAPLQPQLDVIAGIADLAGMHEQMASPAFNGIPDFFNVGLTADP